MFIKLTGSVNNTKIILPIDSIGTIIHSNNIVSVHDKYAPELDPTQVKETPEEIRALIKAEHDKELRDKFAMAALHGLLASQGVECGHYKSADKATADAYHHADAMLAARGE